jgi:hypothetical protein
MATQWVQNGSRLVLKATAGGATVFDGTCGTQINYRANTTISEAQCQESANAEKFVSLINHEISGTFNYQVTDTDSVIGVGSSAVYGIVKTQNGTTIFAGSVLVTNVEDAQGAHGTQETMSITLTNDGAPDVGFGV